MDEANPLKLLSIFESGVLSVSVNGRPFVKVDAESRSVESELAGIKEAGIKLSKILPSGSKNPGLTGLVRSSRSTAKDLYEEGWKFVLYDKGASVFSMGRGVSRLTGHIHVSPTKLRGILEAI